MAMKLSILLVCFARIPTEKNISSIFLRFQDHSTLFWTLAFHGTHLSVQKAVEKPRMVIGAELRLLSPFFGKAEVLEIDQTVFPVLKGTAKRRASHVDFHLTYPFLVSSSFHSA